MSKVPILGVGALEQECYLVKWNAKLLLYNFWNQELKFDLIVSKKHTVHLQYIMLNALMHALGMHAKRSDWMNLQCTALKHRCKGRYADSYVSSLSLGLLMYRVPKMHSLLWLNKRVDINQMYKELVGIIELHNIDLFILKRKYRSRLSPRAQLLRYWVTNSMFTKIFYAW